MVTPTVDSELTEQFLANTPEPVRDNLVLVGDAAAFIDPFVGDGISIALRTGCLAARGATASRSASSIVWPSAAAKTSSLPATARQRQISTSRSSAASSRSGSW